MQVGDLVRWRDGEAIGVIVEVAKDAPSTKYKVLWACLGREEYWFTNKEVEVL